MDRKSSETYYRQGVYPIRNKEKYRGKLPCIYRSSQEYYLMKWCDVNDRIVEWSSESIAIPYRKPTDNRYHRYFVDFHMVYRASDGSTQKYLLEYKPKKFTRRPEKTARMSQKTYNYLCETYMVNQAKWKAANEYAKKHGAKFMVLSEDTIGLSE